VDVVTFLECDVRTVGRRDDLIGGGKAQVFLPIAAVRLHRHQRGPAAAAAGARDFIDPEDATVGSERGTHHLTTRLAGDGRAARTRDRGERYAGIARGRRSGRETNEIVP